MSQREYKYGLQLRFQVKWSSNRIHPARNEIRFQKHNGGGKNARKKPISIKLNILSFPFRQASYGI